MSLNLEVQILGEFKNLTKATKGAQKQLQGFQRTVSGISRSINGTLAAIGVGLSLNALKNSVTGAVREASNLEESINAVRVAFGPAADAVLKIGENSASSFGVARSAFNAAAVRFSSFANIVTSEGGDAAGFIEEITGRAADFASVFNIEVDEALRVFQSGLAGESEPLRRFGVILTDAEVKAFAYAKGIAQTGRELTAAEKVQARYGLLLRETNKVQGDFAATSGSMANALRIMRAGFTDASASIGNGFTPAIAASAQFISDNIGVFDALGEAIGTKLRQAFDNTGNAATAFGGKLIKVVEDFTDFLNGTAEADNGFIKLQETLGPILELVGAFGELAKGLIAVLNGVVDGLFGWINIFLPAGQQVEGFAGFVRFLGEKLQEVGEFIGLVISFFIPFTGGIKLATGVVKAFAGGVGKAIGDVGKFIGKSLEPVGKLLDRLVAKPFEKYFSKVEETASKAFAKDGPIIRGLDDIAKAMKLDEVVETALSNLEKLKGGFKAFIESIPGLSTFLKNLDLAIGAFRSAVSGTQVQAQNEIKTTKAELAKYKADLKTLDGLRIKSFLDVTLNYKTNEKRFSGPGIDPITGKSQLNEPWYIAAQKALQDALNPAGGTGDTVFQTRVKAIVAKLQETLDQARERIKNASESFRDAVGLSFGVITNGFRAKFSVSRVIAQMNRIKSAVATFSKDIIELRKKGADAALIDELIGLGPVAGAAAAKSLVNSSSFDEFINLRRDLASSGAAVGAAGNLAINGTSTSGLTNAIAALNKTIAAGKGNTYNISIANPNITPQQIIAQIKAYEKKTGKKVFSN